jgi:hypothetical protein
MELALLIWFASVSSGIAKLFGLFAIVGLIVLTVIAVVSFLYWADMDERPILFNYKKTLIGLFCLFTGFAVVAVAIPDERTVYLMTAGYIGQQVVTSDKFQKSTDDVYQIVNMKLEQIKHDMKEDLNGDPKDDGKK